MDEDSWTGVVESRFLVAVQILGLENATAAEVLAIVNVSFLTMEDVEAHLVALRKKSGRISPRLNMVLRTREEEEAVVGDLVPAEKFFTGFPLYSIVRPPHASNSAPLSHPDHRDQSAQGQENCSGR